MAVADMEAITEEMAGEVGEAGTTAEVVVAAAETPTGVAAAAIPVVVVVVVVLVTPGRIAWEQSRFG